jgi:hypothetical protein
MLLRSLQHGQISQKVKYKAVILHPKRIPHPKTYTTSTSLPLIRILELGTPPSRFDIFSSNHPKIPVHGGLTVPVGSKR